MTDEPVDDRTAMAVAVGWASTVMTISLEMVIPGLIGYWIDQKLGTQVVFLLLGLAFGITLSIWHLMSVVNRSLGTKRRTNK